jgi:hypothetical protein
MHHSNKHTQNAVLSRNDLAYPNQAIYYVNTGPHCPILFFDERCKER